MEYLLLALIAVVIGGSTYGGYWWATRRNRQVEPRLSAPLSGTGASDTELRSKTGMMQATEMRSKSGMMQATEIRSTPGMAFGDLTPSLAAQLPVGDDARAELQKELRSAGYYSPNALTSYLALRTVLVLMPVLITMAILALFVEEGTTALWLLLGGVVVALLGFSLPRLFIYYKGQARAHAIERGLPAAIDMLSLCLGAGQNVLNSLRRVALEVARPYPELSYELLVVHRQAELRTLEFALTQFAERVNVPHLRNLAVILSQSEQLGTDAVHVLEEYGDTLRVNQKHRAEEMANKAPFKMLFPAYMMAFGAAILIMSPAVLELIDFRNNNILSETREGLPGQLEQPGAATPGGPAPTPAPAPGEPLNVLQ